MNSNPIELNEKEVLRGNTVAGVNAEIIKILLDIDKEFPVQNILDVPCGNGEFLQTVKKFFPRVGLSGADIKEPSQDFGGEFVQINAQKPLNLTAGKNFQIVTCISGVMEFDNTLNFFKDLAHRMSKESVFIVTNDNLLTVGDRLLYLFFGRMRQFPAFIEFSQPTWKVITIQNLRRILWEAGFVVEEIRYVPVRAKEWLWLPLAVPIYITQWLYLRTAEKSVELSEKKAILPFISMLSRHYILICRVNSDQRPL